MRDCGARHAPARRAEPSAAQQQTSMHTTAAPPTPTPLLALPSANLPKPGSQATWRQLPAGARAGRAARWLAALGCTQGPALPTARRLDQSPATQNTTRALRLRTPGHRPTLAAAAPPITTALFPAQRPPFPPARLPARAHAPPLFVHDGSCGCLGRAGARPEAPRRPRARLPALLFASPAPPRLPRPSWARPRGHPRLLLGTCWAAGSSQQGAAHAMRRAQAPAYARPSQTLALSLPRMPVVPPPRARPPPCAVAAAVRACGQ